MAKQRTFAIARAELLDHLESKGWTLSKRDLKVPYATHPHGELRLWFKTQAVYFTYSRSSQHQFGDARTVSYDLDIRKVPADHALVLVEFRFRDELFRGETQAAIAEFKTRLQGFLKQ